MTHPNGEQPECVLRTLNICDGQRLKTKLSRPPCECALIFKRLIEEELGTQCADEWHTTWTLRPVDRPMPESLARALGDRADQFREIVLDGWEHEL